MAFWEQVGLQIRPAGFDSSAARHASDPLTPRSTHSLESDATVEADEGARARQRVMQLVDTMGSWRNQAAQLALNQKVEGSIPSGPTSVK